MPLIVSSQTTSDLSVLVQKRTGLTGTNLLWFLAKDPLRPTDEAGFADAVSHSLEQGAFDLIILGDGIRRELEAVRGYMEAAAGLRARLALVEVASSISGGIPLKR